MVSIIIFFQNILEFKEILIYLYFYNSNQGTPCDLITGEERRFAHSPDTPANHISCSVEMVNINSPCMY